MPPPKNEVDHAARNWGVPARQTDTLLSLLSRSSLSTSSMKDSDSEGGWLHDVLSQPLKAERVQRDDGPKRKRSPASTSSVVTSDPALGKQQKRRKGSARGKARAPSSDTVANEKEAPPTNKRVPRTAAPPNVMFTMYAAARRKDHRAKLRSMQPDQLASTHDQKAERVWEEVKHSFDQRRRNAAAARSTQEDKPCGCIPSIPKHGRDEIEKVRCDFFAASAGLQKAERRHRQAQLAEQCSLDAAKALVGARRKSEESLRLALALVHPYRDLLRLRLATTLSQSVADTASIISLSKNVELSHASATAIAKAKATLFFMRKMVCRFNREVTVCRVNGTGGSSTSDEGSPVRLQRFTSHDSSVSIAFPQTTKALDEPQASVPDPAVSPRMRVVFSQLKAIAAAAAKTMPKNGL